MNTRRPLHTDEQKLGDLLEPIYTDTGCSLEDLPEGMDYRDEWWEVIR